jgi:hypothetical protein
MPSYAPLLSKAVPLPPACVVQLPKGV